MPRALTEIKAHLRMVIANGSISTTLIQTEDLEALCAVADAAQDLMDNSPIGDDDKPYSSDVVGREFDALYLSLQPTT
jgi:hypothetical protein